MRTFLHVDMDAFFASVEMRDNPELQGKPVVVGGSPDGRFGVVTAANYIARKFGIKAGMTAIEAHRRCPKAIFLPGNCRKYVYVSAQIMAALEQFSPDIQPLSVDEATLEIGSVHYLFGGPKAVGRQIKETIRNRFNLPCTVGIAANPLIAKVAADASKPDGLRFIPHGDEAAFLAPMPVDKMCGIGRSTTAVLNRIGIKTLGELGAASETLLRAHFGKVGPMLAQMARGEWAGRMRQDAERRQTTTGEKQTGGSYHGFGHLSTPEDKSIGHERTFGAEIADIGGLRAWIVTLAEMVGRRVRRANVEGRVLTIRIRYDDFTTLSHQTRMTDPTSDEEIIILYGWRLLGEVWHVGRPVRLLGLSLGELKPVNPLGQMDIFYDRTAFRREILYRAMDNLRDRFGEKIITRAMGQRWRRGEMLRISFGMPK